MCCICNVSVLHDFVLLLDEKEGKKGGRKERKQASV